MRTLNKWIPLFIASLLLFTSCQEGSKEAKDEGEAERYMPSDEELRSYIEMEEQLRPLRLRAERDVIEMVQERDMELQRFRELDEAEDPSSLEEPISEEERKALEEIRKERRSIYDERASRMKRRVEDEGLEWQRYQKIRDALRPEGETQERFKSMQDSMGTKLPLPPREKKDYMP